LFSIKKQYEASIAFDLKRCVFLVTIDDHSLAIDLSSWKIDHDIIECKIDDSTNILQLHEINNLGYTLQYLGTKYQIDVLTPLESKLIKYIPPPKELDKHGSLVSPMAGNLVSIAVKPGDTVTIGQELAVVEAMKMQNMLRSTRDGVIKEVLGKAGQPISLDGVILTYK